MSAPEYLKPCPFCGEVDGLDSYQGGADWVICCQHASSEECGHYIEVHAPTESKAIAIWNLRASADDNLMKTVKEHLLEHPELHDSPLHRAWLALDKCNENDDRADDHRA